MFLFFFLLRNEKTLWKGIFSIFKGSGREAPAKSQGWYFSGLVKREDEGQGRVLFYLEVPKLHGTVEGRFC